MCRKSHRFLAFQQGGFIISGRCIELTRIRNVAWAAIIDTFAEFILSRELIYLILWHIQRLRSSMAKSHAILWSTHFRWHCPFVLWPEWEWRIDSQWRRYFWCKVSCRNFVLFAKTYFTNSTRCTSHATMLTANWKLEWNIWFFYVLNRKS